MKSEELPEPSIAVFEELAELAAELHGTACDTTLERAMYGAVEAVENAFCRADWRAYRAWAERYSAFIGVALEPCDAWYDLEDKTQEPYDPGEGEPFCYPSPPWFYDENYERSQTDTNREAPTPREES